jgi:hypothetical protein
MDGGHGRNISGALAADRNSTDPSSIGNLCMALSFRIGVGAELDAVGVVEKNRPGAHIQQILQFTEFRHCKDVVPMHAVDILRINQSPL